LLECCSSKYSINKKNLVVHGDCGVQMPTGITMTTVLNSVSTALMYLYAIARRSDNVVESASDLGLEVKFKDCSEIGELTFLKGWWRKSPNDLYIWLPLPSALIKLGKMLKNPTALFDIERGQDPELFVRDCYRKCSYALGRSYGHVPFDYPIFGPFLAALIRCGKEIPEGSLPSLEESWKPRIEGPVLIDRTEAISAIVARYNIQFFDILRVELLLNSVNSVPSYLQDPVFDVLCAIDY